MPARSGPQGNDQWLLIHKHDAFAQAGWDAEGHPRSVRSGRTNDQVRADAPALWVSGAPAAEAEIDLSAAVPQALPAFVPPMRVTLVSDAFSSESWLFEVKWDGYRVEAVVGDGTVRLFTRNGNDAGAYFPGLLDPPTWILASEAIVDGEVVALDRDGRPDFALLQERISAARAGQRCSGLVYQVFDLLHLDGRSLLGVPLQERKKLLRLVLREGPVVRYAGHVEAEGATFFAAARTAGPRGDRGQAAAPRHTCPANGHADLAEGQDPTRAGARGGRLDTREEGPPGPRRAGRGCVRGRRPAVRGQGGVRVQRSNPRRPGITARPTARRRAPSTRPRTRLTGVAGAGTSPASSGSARSL